MAVEIKQQDNGVTIVSLLGSEAANYMNSEALLDLAAAVTQLKDDEKMRALVLTGSKGTFCGGRVGLKGLTRASDVADDLNIILKVNTAFEALTVPTILAVEGQAFGWAFGMSAQADYVVAADNAVFSLPEMSHGLPPLIVFSYLFKFLSYKRAFELGLTSREISAADAERAGIVTDVVKPGATLDRALEIANFIASKDQKCVALLRTFARHAAEVSNPPLSDYAVSLMSVLLSENAQKAKH